ncbi:L,D-transpeptidase family protein [Chryseobacterium tructae]|nr:L,D-transpeptidase family protein [Chryseobacterium tructae]MDN3692759.1 L,D-transpeptidase family protein [Chryseobacterium tructae]
MTSKHILKASPNVNIANPTHSPEFPKKQKTKETSPPQKKSPVAPREKEVKPDKPKPKEETPKFPQTPAAKKQADPEGKIIHAAFTDATGKPLERAKTGDAISIKIVTQSMKGKNVKVRIWEEDFSRYSNDLVYEKSVTLAFDTTNFINGIILTKDMYTKSYEWGEGNEREYFIEVEHLNTSVTSQAIPVSRDAEPMKVDANDSVAVIKEKEKEEKKINCICQEQYKDLIWGGKVSCEFRKKVVEICKDLWPKNYMVMANNLMACMAWETGESFSPSAKNPKSSATGLIQFMADTAKDLGTTTNALAKMTAVKQLDYVKKYFENIRNKDYEFVDFYLRILFPASMGKPDEHVVFSREGEGLNKSDRNYKERINAYGVNSGFDTNPKYGNGDGMVTKGEIKKGIQKYIDKGKLNKIKVFDCQKGSPVKTLLPEKGTWNVIITEHYTGSKCTHIERTPIRNNCRRGKIEVFDHKGDIVFTIVDCLLEGIKGEDRSKTSADVPYGVYQINQSIPFYSSTATNKITYGPNPRLVFEPIKGSKDEADNSGRSAIRIHGGRQEGYPVKTLKRTEGCIRIYDKDAKEFYTWWTEFKKTNPGVKPGKVIIKK